MSKTIILDSFLAECLKNWLIRIAIKYYLETYCSTTHTKVVLSSDSRMTNQFAKTFIFHPVVMFVNICPAEKEIFASFRYFTQKWFVIHC
jgi:hypothetical protein